MQLLVFGGNNAHGTLDLTTNLSWWRFRALHNLLMDHQQLLAGGNIRPEWARTSGVTTLTCQRLTPATTATSPPPPDPAPPARGEAPIVAVDGGRGMERKKRSSFIRRDNPRGRDALHVADLHPRVGNREEQMTRRQHADARVAPPPMSVRGNDAGAG